MPRVEENKQKTCVLENGYPEISKASTKESASKETGTRESKKQAAPLTHTKLQTIGKRGKKGKPTIQREAFAHRKFKKK